MAKPLMEVVKLGRRGELVLSRKLRAALGLQEGDDLVLTVEEKRIVLERRARAFRTYLDVISSSGKPPAR
jgi:AbrB family looped-hinge helix DNA binding protein